MMNVSPVSSEHLSPHAELNGIASPHPQCESLTPFLECLQQANDAQIEGKGSAVKECVSIEQGFRASQQEATKTDETKATVNAVRLPSAEVLLKAAAPVSKLPAHGSHEKEHTAPSKHHEVPRRSEFRTTENVPASLAAPAVAHDVATPAQLVSSPRPVEDVQGGAQRHVATDPAHTQERKSDAPAFIAAATVPTTPAVGVPASCEAASVQPEAKEVTKVESASPPLARVMPGGSTTDAFPVVAPPSNKAETVSSSAPVHGAGERPRVHVAPPIEVGAIESSAPNRLEVGVRGGTLGWLNVRAEVAADGSVHTLLRAPAPTAASLNSQLGDLRQHLSDHAIDVQQITVTAQKPVASVGAQMSFRQESQQQQSPRDSEQRQREQRGTSAAVVNMEREEEIVSVPLLASVRSGTARASTGGWLSVRA